MIRWRQLAASLSLMLLLGSSVANADDETGLTNRAIAFVTLLSNEKYQDAYGQFDGRVKAAITAAKLESVWHDVINQMGAFKTTGVTKTTESEDHAVVFVESLFEHGSLWVQLAYDKDGEIGGLHFLPKTPEQQQ